LIGFAKGLAADQKKFSVHLIGGDSVATSGSLSVGITAFGRVESGKALKRRGAKAGDGVYVTGSPGDAVLGLHILKHNRALGLSADDADYLVSRYHQPTPRLDVAKGLVGVASAAMDISDGLAGDLVHLCAASGVAATIVASRMPFSPEARRMLDLNPELSNLALSGGDDFELLFTVSSRNEAALASIRAQTGIPITRIGAILAGDAVRIVNDAGQEITGLAGWRHF